MSRVGIKAGDFLGGRSGILKIPWKGECRKNNRQWQQALTISKYKGYKANNNNKRNPSKMCTCTSQPQYFLKTNDWALNHLQSMKYSLTFISHFSS